MVFSVSFFPVEGGLNHVRVLYYIQSFQNGSKPKKNHFDFSESFPTATTAKPYKISENRETGVHLFQESYHCAKFH